MKQINYFVLVFASLSLAACSTSAPPADTVESATTATPSPMRAEPVPEIEYGSFTEDQLFEAIISELGAQRGQVELAGDSYFDLAMSTRDLTIIQRAIQFASVNGDTNALLQLGLLWAELEPSNSQPQLLLSIQFLENGSFQQAISHMARVIELGGNIDFAALSSRTGRLNPQDRAALIDILRQLRIEFSEQDSIHLTLIQLLAQNGSFDESLSELQQLKQRSELTPNLVMLEAQILQNLEQPERALRVMRDGAQRFETDKTVRLSYARMLIQNEDYDLAQREFQALVELDPQDWETLYSIALLDTQLENWDNAIASYEKLIGVDQRADESQYNLGAIYQQLENFEKAIEHFRQVRIGTNNFLAAQQQATRLSIQIGELEDAHDWLSQLSRGQPRLEVLFTTIESSLLIQQGLNAEAEQLLNTALNKFPNETDLLFARVLYYDSQGDRAGSERDLQQIIRMLPEDSRALNHLGYMLADQTDRYDEALELIERAIAVSPDDPAIIDSLGWALYKVGRYEESLVHMRRAFAAFPDDEVASHLGEVLWALERYDEAMRVWQDALEVEPGSPLIIEAMERLQAVE